MNKKLIAVSILGFVFLCFGVFYIGQKIFSKQNFNDSSVDCNRDTSIVEPVYNFDFDEEIQSALVDAHAVAEEYVNAELDKWIEEVMSRVDEKFLDEYFGLLQTKKRELTVLYQTILQKTHLSNKSVENMLEDELEAKISNQIICPEVSAERMKNIADEAIVLYCSTLDKRFSEIRIQHKIPKPVWDKYIEDLCVITLRCEQGYEDSITSIPAKLMAISGITVTTMAVKPLVDVAVKKISAKIAAKSGAELAEKAGAKLAVETAAKAGGKSVVKALPAIGCAVAIGLAVWDVVDYKVNAAKGKEILKESIRDYLFEIKREMMGKSSGSIMSSIILWENEFKNNLAGKGLARY